MNRKHNIIVCGDIHAEFSYLNKLINKHHPKIIFVCGDFGYWPKFDMGKISDIKNKDTKIYWCDGNHEDHWALRERKTDELQSGIFYMPRGTTLTLPDGRVVLFFGGADSIDKNSRTIGFDWFPEEQPTYQDMARLDDIKGKVDIVVSHTCPAEFFEIYSKYGKIKDPTCHLLSYILNRFKPSKWFFGHWHYYNSGEVKGCRWTCLNRVPCSNWWKSLS